jgi:hypothetical protein
VWESTVNGQRLRFRLAGINNQNFIMQDEETGSWWQQVTGRAIAGPLKGQQLTLVPHDEVAFGTWKADHPAGRVLKPEPAVEARDDYAPLEWERRMANTRVVTELSKGSPFTARTLVVGITVNGRSKAYPLGALRRSRLLLDVLDAVPVMLAIAEDGRSVRVFDRRVDGRDHTFVATPSARLMLTDLETMSEWDFAGSALSGPLAGRRLARIAFLLEYWFDWQTYHPATGVFRPWRPVEGTPDRLDIPRPDRHE